MPDLQDQVRHRGAQAAHHGPACSSRSPPGCAPWSSPCSGSATRRARWPAAARSTRWSAPGSAGYDEAALDADLEEPAETEIAKIAAFGGQLQVEAKEWYLAEAIRIALADGPLTGPERAAAVHLATALGMTQAQAIGVIALTGQNAGQS